MSGRASFHNFLSRIEVQIKHTFSGKMTSPGEIMIYFPVAYAIVFTVGLGLLESQKNITRHTIQNKADLAKVC